MTSEPRPPAAATTDAADTAIDRAVDLLRTGDATSLAAMADAVWSWAACVDYEFRRRFPLEHAIWRATVAADGLAAADETDDPAPSTRH